jgi:drug/metabolite transporter (DMT)-like permease
MPIGALALGAAVLHERPSLASLVGMLLIFCGLAVIDGRLRGVRIFGHSQTPRGVGRSRTGC